MNFLTMEDCSVCGNVATHEYVLKGWFGCTSIVYQLCDLHTAEDALRAEEARDCADDIPEVDPA